MCPKPIWKTVVGLLPSLNAPTVASLYQSDMVFRGNGGQHRRGPQSDTGTQLQAGAEGIIEYPLNKVV
jgi:ATP phosphoribosyltransferase